MSRIHLPGILEGNYLVLDQATLHLGRSDEAKAPAAWRQWLYQASSRLVNIGRNYKLAVFAGCFLLVTAPAITIGASYWSAYLASRLAVTSVSAHRPLTFPPLRGPNGRVASPQLASTLQKIISQPLSLTINGQTVAIGADTIKTWVSVVTDKRAGVSYLHVNQTAIAASLKDLTGPFAKTPTDQVTATYADGSSAVIVDGHDGTTVGDTSDLAKNFGAVLLQAKGLQQPVPTASVPFAAVTPAAFDKLLEVNVNTKQMWAYDKGQLVRQFPISAGAPSTPTPLGEYKIYQKLGVQDMKGFNADGTPYLQPHVHWINYFLPGGYAVHGNYWRPLSYFGAINSSHGCVSLPDDQAEWVYDWAPLGTTVITHA